MDTQTQNKARGKTLSKTQKRTNELRQAMRPTQETAKRPIARPTASLDTTNERSAIGSLVQTAGRSIFVGFVATQVLDIVSHLLYVGLDPKIIQEEERVRGNKQAFEVAVQKIAAVFGRELNESEMKYWGWKFHRSFGMAGGLQFMSLRKAMPAVGYGYGIPFGIAFWALADEFGIWAAGLVPGQQKFSWQSHARGLIAHVAWGMAAELTARSYDMIDQYEGNTPEFNLRTLANVQISQRART